ncbi:MAG: hypothetical protein V1861_03485 [Candidatus Micrarchaeota archaeon]
MDRAYVSEEKFKMLEAKVNRILDVHALDEKLTRKEQERVNEAKKDIKKKSNFTSVEGL